MFPGLAVLVAALAFVFAPAPSYGQGKQIPSQTAGPGTTQDFSRARMLPPLSTAALLPTASTVPNRIYIVTDASSSSVCTAGGTSHVWCQAISGTWTAIGGGGGGGSGTVTSVGFTGGLISVATATTTPALTVAGTSGGVPYFSSASTWASSAVLTANLPVIGGGAGSAPAVGTRSGNTTAFVTTTGPQTSGRCVEIDASGNHIAGAAVCGTGTGTVTVVGAGALTSTALMTGGGTTTTQTPSATSTLDSSGNMALAGALSTGTSPPTPTPGTGGVFALGEGTASTAQAGADICYADSTAHNVRCSYNNGAFFPVTRTIGTNTLALATSAIASQDCSSAQTLTLTGTLSGDGPIVAFSADVTAVTGYAPLTAGGLYLQYWLTADTFNVKVCNPTSGSITPGAASLVVRVTR